MWRKAAEGSWLKAAASKRRASNSVVMKDGLSIRVGLWRAGIFWGEGDVLVISWTSVVVSDFEEYSFER